MFGGSGEVRTHGPISGTAVFKTAAINQTLPHFQIFICSTYSLWIAIAPLSFVALFNEPSILITRVATPMIRNATLCSG